MVTIVLLNVNQEYETAAMRRPFVVSLTLFTNCVSSRFISLMFQCHLCFVFLFKICVHSIYFMPGTVLANFSNNLFNPHKNLMWLSKLYMFYRRVTKKLRNLLKVTQLEKIELGLTPTLFDSRIHVLDCCAMILSFLLFPMDLLQSRMESEDSSKGPEAYFKASVYTQKLQLMDISIALKIMVIFII